MNIRAFVAINFSVPATRRLAEAAADLRKQAMAAATELRATWVPTANLHLTLKFLGEIPEENASAILLALRRGLQSASPLGSIDPFEIRAGGFGAFPSLETARVLWFGVDGGAMLGKLAERIEQALFELGFPREARPLSPHVTIGRVTEGVWPASVTTQRAEIATSRITEVVLYESRPVQKGQEYVALGRIGIGALARAAEEAGQLATSARR